jgi:hypothetical protein
MGKVLICCGILVVFLVGAAFKYERDHPCLEYGPERLQYMQKVGSTLIPVYGKDCLRRANL